MKAINFEGVSFGYNADTVVFENISFQINVGDKGSSIVGILGNSGSGKTTILKLLLNSLQPDSGTISLYPKNPIISYIPQEAVLFTHLSPLENARYFSRIGAYKNLFDENRFERLVEELHIEDVLVKESVSDMSGGQRQRLSLLRAMSVNPDFLLLDEPLSGLDEMIKSDFLQTLLRISHERELLVLYITHHAREIELISDKVLYLDRNSVQLYDTADFFRVPPSISALCAVNGADMITLRVTIDEYGDISVLNDRCGHKCYITFHESCLNFSDVEGWSCEEMFDTPMFRYVKIGDEQVTLHKPVVVKGKVFIAGSLLMYPLDGSLPVSKQVTNNRILNW